MSPYKVAPSRQTSAKINHAFTGVPPRLTTEGLAPSVVGESLLPAALGAAGHGHESEGEWPFSGDAGTGSPQPLAAD